MLQQRNPHNKQSTRRRKETHKPWYSAECETKRHKYIRFKNKYRALKNNQSLQQLRYATKEYNKEINTSFNKYKSKIAKQIRNLSSSPPKYFWEIINKDRPPQSVNDLPLDTFKKHFESLNSGNGEDIIDRPNLDINMDNIILNEPLTEIEVKKAMKTLKNNKCGGIDLILNEFIKNSPDILIGILVKLFNVILDSELIPTDWCLGIIKPLF